MRRLVRRGPGGSTARGGAGDPFAQRGDRRRQLRILGWWQRSRHREPEPARKLPQVVAIAARGLVLRQRLQDRLLAQFLAKMPGLRGMVDHVELSTPLTTDHFVRPTRGSIYGIEPTPERFANPHLRPRSPIPGLFLAGSDVATVGVIGAMMGGVLAAASIAPRRALGLLRGL